MDFRRRCHDPELMDDFGVESRDIEDALREIGVINRFLGGASTTLAGLTPYLAGRRDPVRLLDVGTGGADLPVAVARWCRAAGVAIRIVAVDLGAAACRFARAQARDFPEIEICRADVFALPLPPRSFHLAHCAMFLHHFDQDEAARILRAMAPLVTEGIVINDLHRHAFAYHSIRVLTGLFSRSRLVRNDAPLSVRRGFRAADLDDLKARCSFSSFHYRRTWAFRYLCDLRVNGDANGNANGSANGDG
jgi:hypothetical protein